MYEFLKIFLDSYCMKILDSKPGASNRTVLTPQILKILHAHKKRTGMGAWAILRDARDIPKGLNYGTINAWFRGKVSSVRTDYLSYVLLRYESQPDLNLAPITKSMRNARKRKKSKRDERSAQNAEMITITNDVHAEIVEEIKRTRIGPVSFFMAVKEVPPGLNSKIFSSWVSREITKANKIHLDFVREHLKKLPTKKGAISPQKSKRKSPTIFNKQDITPEILKKLRGYADEKYLPKKIFKFFDDAPDSLYPGKISNWLAGIQKTAPKEHIEYVLDGCKKMKAHYELHTVEITDEIFEKLKKYSDRRGFLPERIFALSENVPQSLDAREIKKWLNRRKSRVNKDHLEFILRACEELEKNNKEYVEITENIREALLFHRKRTGVGPGKLLSYADKIPDGLTSPMINTWFSKNVMTARKDYLLFVQENYDKMPSEGQTTKERLAELQTGISSKKEYIELTEEILYHLFTHKVRTGVSPKKLLQDKNNIPAGLEFRDVNAWMKRAYQRIPKNHYLYVIAEWEKVPSKV
ncbi:MAG: hypothetical protein DYH13_10955 [Alphaproteobacteria bacterium PRO2]|nr:hypothetical protein [Alphaproteobacteria bacterium PRO2]